MEVMVLRIIYRAIVLIAVFIMALSYFSGDIKEVVFNIDNTTTMEDATFPLVTIKTGENIINLLHGYSSNLDADKIRDSVTPLDMNKTFEVVINQEGYVIKKLNYEVREFTGNSLIESDSVSVFEEDGNNKTAKINLIAELTPEKEYAVKITLITSESKKMYFYQRIKIYDDSHLSDKLAFIMNFHKAIMNKVSAENIVNYLEPSNEADNTTLAYVNINSSFDLISWGNLKPTVLSEVIPTVLEIYEDTASVKLDYVISADVAGNTEKYQVTEFYRIRWSKDRMYLLNYDRYMESLFDVSLASVSQSQLKLGITSDHDIYYTAGADKSKIAFVRNKELWFYDLEKNEMTKVFSFRNNTDDIRDLYDQHDIRIINMDAEGNMYFMVYGYMNRGQYEGRVAIILYHFIRAESRIEELVYIPADEPYQTLKEHIGDLSYVNSKEVFYFQVNDNIYSYDLITKKLSVIASNINKDQVVVLRDLNYVAWQENADTSKSDNIYIMNLETGATDTIPARQGYNIRLMDKIDSNIIYGYVNKGDIATMIDGSIMAPPSSIEIASINKNILKSYSKPGIYISGITVQDNRIELNRVQKQSEGSSFTYAATTSDTIMNQRKVDTPLVGVIPRVTEQALTEYYMTLPSGFVMNQTPGILTTVSTVISQDPTVRLPESKQDTLLYYPYTVKGMEGEYVNASDAILKAKESAGVVLDNNMRLIWERGVKATTKIISDFENMNYEATPDQTVEGCIQIMLKYQGVNTSISNLSVAGSSIYDVLAKYSRYTPVRLTGITLDDALYYVSQGRPVIAMTGINKAVLIYGYDTFNIMVVDPTTGKTDKIGIQDSTGLFNNAGNVFLSYLEQ